MTRDEAIDLAASALEAGAEVFAAGIDYFEVGARVDRALGTSEMGSRDTFVRWHEVAAALRAPEADADGWIPWGGGGECPAPGVPGEARLRSGNITRRDDLSSLRWAHAGVPGDIVAYRITGFAPAPAPAPAPPAFVPGFRPAPAPALPEAPDGVTWALCVIIDDTDATLTREPHPCDGATPGYRIQTPGDRSMPAVDLWLGADDVGRLVAALRLLGAPA